VRTLPCPTGEAWGRRMDRGASTSRERISARLERELKRLSSLYRSRSGLRPVPKSCCFGPISRCNHCSFVHRTGCQRACSRGTDEQVRSLIAVRVATVPK
jgi:hypothetical protein